MVVGSGSLAIGVLVYAFHVALGKRVYPGLGRRPARLGVGLARTLVGTLAHTLGHRTVMRTSTLCRPDGSTYSIVNKKTFQIFSQNTTRTHFP